MVVHVRKIEGELLIRIANGSVAVVVFGLRQPFLPRHLRAIGDQLGNVTAISRVSRDARFRRTFVGLQNLQRTLLRRRHDDYARARSVEMTQYPSAVLIGAAISTRIA